MALDEESRRRIVPALKDLLRHSLLANPEGMFVLSTFLIIGFILYFADQRLSFLNLYFIPILLAGYFLNTRSAVLGSLLAVLVVTFILLLKPDTFHQEPSRMGVYLDIVNWGSFLILTGYLVGTMNEQLREKFLKARDTLLKLNDLQEDLSRKNSDLESRNVSLEANKSQMESVLHATMDPLIAKLILERRLKNERRTLSVLTADLVDFNDRTKDQAPEQVIEELNRLFCAVEPIIGLYRGHLDRYDGAGLAAEFGLPLDARRHAALAAVSALKIQERLKKDFPWTMRIGVASGNALVGLIGSDRRKNYTALGDTISVARTLRTACAPGGVLVSGEVFQEIKQWCDARRVERQFGRAGDGRRKDEAAAYAWGSVSLRRRSDSAEAYEILGLKDPLEDALRVPATAAARFRELRMSLALPERFILPIEAMEGTIGHAQVTAALAAELAHAVGLDEPNQRAVFLAGYLHDIGKRGVPEPAIRPDDPLGDAGGDSPAMREHVRHSLRLISDLGLPVSVETLDAIGQHHERLDGSGYPEGLSGETISMAARLVQIADAYESLTAWRPGREAAAPAKAVARLGELAAAGRIDAKIFAMFAKVVAPVLR
ncbi:MAG: HD domain-containing protein [Elusimicrobia bacterium]|nr:HD domain-containing protein [Elusimicrobiota bacterium]